MKENYHTGGCDEYVCDGLAGLSYGIDRLAAVLRKNGDENGIT